jgi:hypothetical protein
MRLTKTYDSDAEAKRASSRTLLRPGWHDARITEAVEKVSQRGNDTIELTVVIADRTLRDWLTGADRAAAKMRSCCVAVSALGAYEAREISQELFPGHDVQVKISVEKRRGFPDQNRIDEYRAPAASSVVNLRAAQ